MRLLALALATGCGVGYIRFAPGTFGSVLGLAIWAAVPQTVLGQAAAIFSLSAVGAWSATAAEQHFGQADPGPVVVDEVAGMMLTLFLNPVGWAGMATGFFLFRFFDVVKPYPAKHVERLPGGVGIVADDLVAAVYGNLTLRATLALGSWMLR